MKIMRYGGVLLSLIFGFNGLCAQENRSMLSGLRQLFARSTTESQEQDPLRIQKICVIFHGMLLDYVLDKNNITYQQVIEFYKQHELQLKKEGLFQYGVTRDLDESNQCFYVLMGTSQSYIQVALVLFLDTYLKFSVYGTDDANSPEWAQTVGARVNQISEFLLTNGSGIEFTSAAGVNYSALNDALILNDPVLVDLIMPFVKAGNSKESKILQKRVFELSNAISSGQNAAVFNNFNSISVLNILLDPANADKIAYTSSHLEKLENYLLSVQNNSDNDNGWVIIEKLLQQAPPGSAIYQKFKRSVFYNVTGLMEDKALPADIKMNNVLRMIKKSVEVGQKMQLFDAKQRDQIFEGYINFIARNDVWHKGTTRSVQSEDYISVLPLILALQPSSAALSNVQTKVKEYVKKDPYNKYWQEIEALIDSVISEKFEKNIGMLDRLVKRPVVEYQDPLTGLDATADTFPLDMQSEVLEFLTGVEHKEPVSAGDQQARDDMQRDRDAQQEQQSAAAIAAQEDELRKQHAEWKKKTELDEALNASSPNDESDLNE